MSLAESGSGFHPSRLVAEASAALLFIGGAVPSFAQAAGRVALGAPAPGSRAGLLFDLGNTLRRLIRPDAGPDGAALVVATALAYGILHALGPGHQKTLIAGLGLSGKGGAAEAAKAAAVAAGSHAASVIALFGGLALFSGSMSIAAGDAAGDVVAKSSGLALVALSALLLVKRCRAASERHRPPRAEPGIGVAEPGCPGCHGRGHRTRDGQTTMTIVALGSLVPCPGAAFFLLYGFSAGNPIAGIASVLAISAGMWITLFAVGLAAAGTRRLGERRAARASGSRERAIRSALEIGGALLVLFFAVSLVL